MSPNGSDAIHDCGEPGQHLLQVFICQLRWVEAEMLADLIKQGLYSLLARQRVPMLLKVGLEQGLKQSTRGRKRAPRIFIHRRKGTRQLLLH